MDLQEASKFTQSFRNALQIFYKTKGYHENTAIQDYTTQLYWNILELQHRRLEELGIDLDFTSLQKKYTDDGPMKFEACFDGKYEISQVTEEIASTRLYRRQGREIYTKKSNQLAYYTFLNAKEQGPNEIICPNCGNSTTRENLLDGCDYCHSKFTVEDLGVRISNFALRSDWGITKTKYEQNKEEITGWVDLIISLLGATVGFIISILVLPFTSMNFLPKIGCGILIIAGCGFAAKAIIHAFINGLARSATLDVGKALGGPSTGNVNVGEAIAESIYAEQEMQDVVQEQDTISPKTASKVKEYDSLFSLKGFLSNAQNKLNAIIFADTPKQINALATCELSKFIDDYKYVFEADVVSLHFLDYNRTEELQKAQLKTKLHLVSRNPQGHIIERQDIAELELEKSIHCTTQAVRGPEVLRCKGCGATLSLLEGKTCAYCGRELNLVDHDWAIADYKIIESKVIRTYV